MQAIDRARVFMILATALVVLPSRDALALAGPACSAYAEKAVELARKAAAMKCGFVGDGWSTDPNVYKRECLGFGAVATPSDRNNARQKALNQCSACGTYAADASN